MRKKLTAMALSLALLSTTALAAESGPTSPALSAIGSGGQQTSEQKPLFQTDPEGTVTFANLERRIRENNLNLLMLEETIASIESTDYDKLYEDLRDSLNSIADAQWMMIQANNAGIMPLDTYTYGQLDATYDSIRDTFEDLKDGKIQRDSADAVWQLENAQDQVVMGAETLYIALVGLETQEASLTRQLEALDRTAAEMELRHQLGQISALQLQQVTSGRATLASGLETLRMNIKTYKMQLESMLGVELTGQLQLGALPAVQSSQLEKMDLEADLTAAREKSYQLYDAKKTLEDAQEDYKDAGKEYGYNEKKYQFVAAKHTWQAAQYSYEATVQNYELSFRTTYLQVKDYQQALAAAQSSLDYERSSYAATELKYSQGAISKNALLEAQDKVTSAEAAVQTAAENLFSAYHTYRWAVEYGILN